MELFPYILALCWGAILAMFLQLTGIGRWLVLKRAWVAVMIGVGVVLLIILAMVPFELWWKVALVFALFATPLIIRSLLNEQAETDAEIDAIDEP